jgi:HSP20 family protein
MEIPAQNVPVRISKSDAHFLLVAPMPGVKPADISITITGRSVKILGHQTGPGQDEKHIIVEEWTIGPYFREVELPEAVNGSLANATLGNGILTLAMPKGNEEDPSPVVTFELQSTGPGRGERIGHKGISIDPTC